MSHDALLVMDVQQGIVNRFAGDDTDAYLAKVQRAVDAAHFADIPVIYVTVRFRTGYPEISARNKTFCTIAQQNSAMTETHAATQLVMEPAGNDIIVTKRRVSAFSGSDLEVILRSLEVDHLVLCGIATGGVVLSTLREAADKDYRITVLENGCLDNDPEVHRVLMTKIFPRQADVIAVEEWRTSISR